ncbi:MAG: FG-GAP repeat protein, partial [Bacteroidota bacterium]
MTPWSGCLWTNFRTSWSLRGGATESASLTEAISAALNETEKLTASDGAGSDFFGYSVSLSGDRALIGVLGDDDNGFSSGSAYVFDFDGSSWTETEKLTASDGAEFDGFGWSVSLSGDRALIGAVLDDDNANDSGSAYVFDFDGTSWTE